MKPVKIKDIVEEMEILSDEINCFLNKETGEIISVGEEELSIAEDSEEEEDDDFSEYPEWQQEAIKQALDTIVNCNKYIELPDRIEINEYDIMERFCNSIDNEKISDELQNAIQGRGAFRRFKDAIVRFNIEDEWYKYRKNAYKKIAIDWCELNDIEFIE